jgi:outer membrane protein W
MSGLVAVAAMLVLPAVAQAQAAAPAASKPMAFGVQASYASDDVNFGVGLRYQNTLNKLAGNLPLRLAASAEWFFPDGGDIYDINANVLYAFNLQGSPLRPYAGAGLNFTMVSPDNGDSDNEIGANIVGGVGFTTGKLKPFVEARYTTSYDGRFIISGGLLF